MLWSCLVSLCHKQNPIGAFAVSFDNYDGSSKMQTDVERKPDKGLTLRGYGRK